MTTTYEKYDQVIRGGSEPAVRVIFEEETFPTTELEIHPWDRASGTDRSVYIGLQVGDNPWAQEIFDRDVFVEAILAVFPELKRVDS